jgi:hypothetical protein
MISDRFKIPENDSDWEKLISDWIAAEESGKRTSDQDPKWWAVDEVILWHILGNHKALWDFVVRVFERPMSDRAFGMIAAGPLEDLLGDYGELYIDRIEEMARKNPRFNYLLGGLWRSSSKPDIWSRIEQIRLNTW